MAALTGKIPARSVLLSSTWSRYYDLTEKGEGSCAPPATGISRRPLARARGGFQATGKERIRQDVPPHFWGLDDLTPSRSTNPTIAGGTAQVWL